MIEISQQDKDNIILLRNNIEAFMDYVGKNYATKQGTLLDIAPQDHLGARPFFSKDIDIYTLDINPTSGADYIADLCNCSSLVGKNKWDYIVCTEVLEHTKQPFDAASNILDMLKVGGYAFITTPFNLRVHGPRPDCWRFTEDGLRELFKYFEIVELNTLDTHDRQLMPIQYTLVVRKK